MHLIKRTGLLILCGLCLLMPCKRKVHAQNAVSAPSVTAQNVLIQNRETGRVLYEKAAYTPVPMASTTKMMTAIIIAESCTLSDTVTVSRTASAIHGSTMHLAHGEQISVRALLYGLLLCSGNDAAIALAEFASGSVEDFCTQMNRKAALLGATNTHFTSPHGLDHEEHYTTAYDLAQIAEAFMQIPILTQICATKQITIEGHNLTNTNPLLGTDPHVTGIKTGYTGNAGYCLVVSAKGNGASFIIVLLNCPTSDARKQDAQKLTDYAVSQYTLYDICPRGYIAATLSVKKGQDETVDAVLPGRVRLALTEEEYGKIQFEFIPSSSQLQAPIQGGSVLGTFQILLEDECLYQCDAVAFRQVAHTSFWGNFLKIITELAYLFP